MNRHIRAEEMLRTAKMPGTMAIRDRSRLSTPAAHSDLPIDPSPIAPSTTSSDKLRCHSPSKGKRREKAPKEDFITTSPQPFKFSTAERAAKKASTFIFTHSRLKLNVTGSSVKNEFITHDFDCFFIYFRWKK